MSLPNSAPVLCVVTGLPQDVRQYVGAVADAGWLRGLVTGGAYHEGGALARVLGLVDRLLGSRWLQRSAHRRIGTVPATRLHPQVWPEVRLRLGRRLGLIAEAPQSMDAFAEVVDRAGAARVRPEVRLVIAREDVCLHTFRAARRVAARCVFDLPMPHHGTVREALERDHALFPEAGLGFDPRAEFHPDRVARKDAELAAADHVLVASCFVRDSLLAHGISPDRITAIPYGCDPGRPLSATPRRDRTVLYVGHLSLRKGVPRLLRAWKRLGAHRTHRLRLIGKMMLEPRFCADFAGCYEHLPPMPRGDLWRHYAESQFFVFPSLADGFGLVLNEAMSSGLAVLASDHTGAPGFVRPGEHGLIYPHDDEDRLCAALEEMLSRPRRTAEMGRAAYELAQSWTWASYRARVQEVVGGLLGSGAAELACAEGSRAALVGRR
jgi:glycosyltransferase involved in cell wall biosynthesis